MKETPARYVITHEVAAPSATIERSFSGVTSAAQSAELGFEVAGRIIEIVAVRGRRYDTDAVLAKIDVSTYRSELSQAKAESTRAAQNLKRVQQLFERGSSSKAQLDSAIAAQQTAAAAMETATKKVSDGVLVMPYPGFVSEVIREKQEVVGAGTAVLRIQGGGDMELEIGVPGDVVDLIPVGHPATVRLGRELDREIPARVYKVATRASADTTYAITLSLEKGDTELRDGLDGEATLELPNPNGSTTAVPSVCIVGDPSGERFVWVVENMSSGGQSVTKRIVQVGNIRADGQVEILSELAPGTRIVARGVHSVRAGMKIRTTDQ